MTFSTRLLLGLIPLVASLVGCATPAPIVRLDPRGKNVVWVAGRAVVAKEAGGVRVATAFEQQDGSMLAIRLEVENQLSTPIEVSPNDLVFSTCATADSESCVGAYSVVDPEEAIQALDKLGSRERAEASNEAALNTSLVLLSAVGDVASIAGGHADRHTGHGTIALAEHAEAAGARAEVSIGSIASRRQVWSDVAFRRNTVAPGQGVAGLVYVPIESKAQYLWLWVRVAGQTFPFGFKQTVRAVEPANDGGGGYANR